MKLIRKTFIIFVCIAVTNLNNVLSSKTSTKTNSKNKESMIEFLNNYFSDNNSNLYPYDNKQSKNNLNENMRFKEDKPATPSVTNTPTTPAPAANAATTPSPAVPITTATAATNTKTDKPTESENGILEGWFAISSQTFNERSKFPPVRLPSGKSISVLTDGNFRVNEVFGKDTPGAPNKYYFYFRLSGEMIYYSNSKADMNVLGALNVKNLNEVKLVTGLNDYDRKITDCFSTKDNDNYNWNICGTDNIVLRKWVCRIKTVTNTIDPMCSMDNNNIRNITVEEVKVTQPVIVIPLPSRMCNEDYDYKSGGLDWECDCKGTEQSPIDLPAKETAVPSPVKPYLQYQEISVKNKKNAKTGQETVTDHVTIKLSNKALRVKHDNLGKLVQIDGAVYRAKEIVFRTPAEHTIDGKKFDMEVQIIHEGVTTGDLAKNAIVSFLFEKHPGFYNKFLDDFDIFNLPNSDSPVRNLKTNLFLPRIFYNSDDIAPSTLRPFSFYTYQGSLTAPPCTENTVVYVASNPIKIGTTVLELFQEALRVPDAVDPTTNTILSNNETPANARKTQALNNRTVFHYDHQKYCGPDFVEKKDESKGHFESVDTVVSQYFYVNTPVPSGMPGAKVVSDEEVKGKQ